MRDLKELTELEPLAEDADFRAKWREMKRNNKRQFSDYVRTRTGMSIDPESLFDVQVKRIHEYKRQHLNILHVIALYTRLKSGGSSESRIAADVSVRRQGRARLPHGQADDQADHLGRRSLNRDAAVRDRIRVVFLPNFNVSTGQQVYPAAELCEQISTAGMEASGTGNMKFSLNGAPTIGTLDGANIEIRQEVGEENFFLFGLSAEEVAAARCRGYCPAELLAGDAELREVLQLIRSGFFSRGDAGLFRPLLDSLTGEDPYMVLADFRSYCECQKRVDLAYSDQERWTAMSILNTARSGRFSSDRTIREYCREIWRAERVAIDLLSQNEVKPGVLQ